MNKQLPNRNATTLYSYIYIYMFIHKDICVNEFRIDNHKTISTWYKTYIQIIDKSNHNPWPSVRMKCLNLYANDKKYFNLHLKFVFMQSSNPSVTR